VFTPSSKVTADRDPKARTRSEASRSDAQQHRPEAPPGSPEWTERWKRQVEAEARGRLKKNLAVLRLQR
jgi:hypothetical protein